MFSFWESSQHKYIERAKKITYDVVDLGAQKQFSIKDQKLVIIHYLQKLKKLGKEMKIPHVVVMTAMIYFRRFYVENNVSVCDPMLLAPVCLLLASKIEEFPLNIDMILAHWIYNRDYSSAHFLDLEQFLMKELSFQFLIYHPFFMLEKYLKNLRENRVYVLESEHEIMRQCSWNIANDCYLSEAILQYPPFTIALTAIYMTSIIYEKEFSEEFRPRIEAWIQEQRIVMSTIGEIVEKILDLYQLLKNDSHSQVADLKMYYEMKLKEIQQISPPLMSNVPPPGYMHHLQSHQRSMNISQRYRNIPSHHHR